MKIKINFMIYCFSFQMVKNTSNLNRKKLVKKIDRKCKDY